MEVLGFTSTRMTIIISVTNNPNPVKEKNTEKIIGNAPDIPRIEQHKKEKGSYNHSHGMPKPLNRVDMNKEEIILIGIKIFGTILRNSAEILFTSLFIHYPFCVLWSVTH